MIMAGMCASAISAAEEKKVENKKVNYQTYAAELDKGRNIVPILLIFFSFIVENGMEFV